MLQAVMEDKHDAGCSVHYAPTSLRSKKKDLELALGGSFTGNQHWLLAADREEKHLEWLETDFQVLGQGN